MTNPILQIRSLEKTFTLHTQNSAVLKVLDRVDLDVMTGEVVALCGPSGAGKSSLLKAIFGTYRASGGSILFDDGNRRMEITSAEPRQMMELRRTSIGYVSQFLRVIPRVPTLDIVAEAAIQQGADLEMAKTRAVDLLEALRIPAALHSLSPLTFSGGEQQRVNIARAMSAPRPLMLFDEPTASLDPANRATVLGMIRNLNRDGTAIVGIFHDPDDRARIGAREFQLAPLKEPAHV